MPDHTLTEQRTTEVQHQGPTSEASTATKPLGQQEVRIVEKLDTLIGNDPDEALQAIVEIHDPAETEAASQDLENVLSEIRRKGDLDPYELAGTLSKANELSVNDLDATMAKLRRGRSINGYTRTYGVVHKLDDTLVVLAKAGERNLVKSLITSSPKEIEELDAAVERSAIEDQEKGSLKETIHAIHAEKSTELKQELTALGWNEQAQQTVLTKLVDPDTIIGVPPEFWQTFASFPAGVKGRFMEYQGDLKQAAEQFTAIYQHGLIEYLDHSLLGTLGKFDSPEEQTAFLVSLKKAEAIIPSDTKSRDAQISKADMMRLLSVRSIIKPEDVQALISLQTFCNQQGNEYVSGYSKIAEYIREQDNTPAAAQAVIDTLTKAKGFIESGSVSVYDIVASGEPKVFVDALFTVEPIIPREKRSVKQLVRRLKGNQPRDARLLQYASAELVLQKTGSSMDAMDEKEAAAFMAKFNQIKQRGQQELHTFGRDWHVNYQLQSIMDAKLAPAIETGNMKDIQQGRITLERLPALQERFQSLGINPELGSEMFNSWYSHNAYQVELYKLNLEGKQPSKEQVAKSLNIAKDIQPAMIALQLAALTKYAESYGSENLQDVIKIFGIYNFARYKPEQLRDQLERWQKGDDQPKNIVVGARADWNASFLRSGPQALETFGNEGLYMFEANNAHDISMVAIDIGKREQTNGRDPLTTNSVKNFTISAHGNPDLMEIGVNGELIQTTDYLRAEHNRNKIGAKVNNYRRHLGNSFRLILQSCNTASESRRGRSNIATTMGKGHSMQTEASTDIVTRITVNPDDSVTFMNTEGKPTASSQYIPEE